MIPRGFRASLCLATWLAGPALVAEAQQPPGWPVDPAQRQERTSFQTHAPWRPGIQIGSDVAICYGIDKSMPERIAGWKQQGYVTHLMTGVSWGEYQDYLYGRFDGINHEDEAQTERSGKKISHGGDVYYMSPGVNYGNFLAEGVKRAIAAGAEAIHLEEPEFWVRGGYSEGFKREWKAYYGEDWIAPHSSPDAQYRASLLKYHLYGRALKQVFDAVKAENARLGKDVRCYVPTHSLINYAEWGIVSPESSLTRVGADGYIAQVWTGTARTPNFYEGKKRERTFEAAFLEYGAMTNIVLGSNAKVWFLNDPIEDNPDHSWDDYRTNWESTLTASLLWPSVAQFEVMPWPERIFGGRYPTVDQSRRKPGEKVVKEPIPAAYATEMLTVVNALNDMKQPEVAWTCGTRGIGILVSDSMMFQRGEPSPSDEDFGSFYGLALPLVKRGMPVEPVQLENATLEGSMTPYKVLFLTYEGMKPMSPEVHDALAAWVKAGGVLVFIDDDNDPYNAVRSWWNAGKGGMDYKLPRAHLFEKLGLPVGTPEGRHAVGSGFVVVDRSSPAALSHRADGGDKVRALAREACEAARVSYVETNHLALRRGPYVVAAGLDESIADAPPITLKGRFVDLFDAGLPVVDRVDLAPGSRRLLLDLDKIAPRGPTVLAAAARIRDPKVEANRFTFQAEGPDRTEAAVRLALASRPTRVEVSPREGGAEPNRLDGAWDEPTRTLLIRFPNRAAGQVVSIE